MKSILITGVTSGIGYELARKFIENHYQVFGTVRSIEKGNALKQELGASFMPVLLDLKDTKSIVQASEKVKAELNNIHLSGLINNAGAAKIGPLLHVPLDDFRNELELLVTGQLSIIQNFYSLLIPKDTKTENSGRIINISSLSGTTGNYGYGGYSAGKHALEGLSKTLRLEITKLFGIKVIVIAPGNIDTSLWDKQLTTDIEAYKNTPYYHQFRASTKSNANEITRKSMIDPKEFADILANIFEKEAPAERYMVQKIKYLWGSPKTLVFSKEPRALRINNLLRRILGKLGK